MEKRKAEEIYGQYFAHSVYFNQDNTPPLGRISKLIFSTMGRAQSAKKALLFSRADDAVWEGGVTCTYLLLHNRGACVSVLRYSSIIFIGPDAALNPLWRHSYDVIHNQKIKDTVSSAGPQGGARSGSPMSQFVHQLEDCQKRSRTIQTVVYSKIPMQPTFLYIYLTNALHDRHIYL